MLHDALFEPPSDIHILLVDDHALFRSGIRSLLQRHPDCLVVGEAADAIEAVKRAKQLQPQVILLDLHMTGMSGLSALPMIRQASPQSAILMLTVSEDTDDLTAALQAGAQGYLIKNMDAQDLVRAIRRAAAGDSVVADAMTSKLVQKIQHPTLASHTEAQGLEKLTPREREILTYLARGERNKSIAKELNMADCTVKAHVQNILKKLNLTSRVQAAVFASQRRVE